MYYDGAIAFQIDLNLDKFNPETGVPNIPCLTPTGKPSVIVFNPFHIVAVRQFFDAHAVKLVSYEYERSFIDEIFQLRYPNNNN